MIIQIDTREKARAIKGIISEFDKQKIEPQALEDQEGQFGLFSG